VRSHRRAFSLIEVLLAVFILGVGVISIAALFPAGIVQQRLSVDDVMGPMVANNALTVLHSKLHQDDFGYVTTASLTNPGHETVQGDFAWRRPSFYFGANDASPAWERGINIFQDTGTPTEIPYNIAKYPAGPPNIRITQGERYYPMSPLKDISSPAAGFLNDQLAKPQYVWDCVFRRFQGKVLVAIFVYRVNAPGGGPVSYSVGRIPPGGTQTDPPIPITIPVSWNADTGTLPNCGSATNPITTAPITSPYPNDDDRDCWREPRQWIIDQNNNIHRVLAQYRDNDNPVNPLKIELLRPVPAMPQAKAFFLPGPANAASVQAVVSKIWFLPLKMDMNHDGTPDVIITPVYATVKEL